MSDRIVGTVNRFKNAKGSGYIAADHHESDVFVHFRSFQGDRTLNEGQAVGFTLIEEPRGLPVEDVAKI